MKKVLGRLLLLLIAAISAVGFAACKTGEEKHNYKDGVCSLCRKLQIADEKYFEFTYNSSDDTYSIAVKNKNDLPMGIVLPDRYNGKSVTGIGGWAFYNCSSLTSVVIPDSVTSIGNNAFWNCNLTSVTIPDNVTCIGAYAFAHCNGLTSVTIGNSVTDIGDSAFAYCHSLTSVVISDSVTSIGDSVFSICSSLTSITIPESVARIGEDAFAYCYGINDITFKGTKKEWKAISKGMGWENGILTSVVHCTDGDVAI